MRRSSRISFFLGIPLLALGFYGLTSNAHVIPLSLYPCCDNGMCNEIDCTATSGMLLKPECAVYNTTCRLCVDYTVSSCLCSTGSYRCKNPDGTFYYGQFVQCPAQSRPTL